LLYPCMVEARQCRAPTADIQDNGMQLAGLAPFIDCSNVKYWRVQMCLEYEIQGITFNPSDHLQQVLKFWVILE